MRHEIITPSQDNNTVQGMVYLLVEGGSTYQVEIDVGKIHLGGHECTITRRFIKIDNQAQPQVLIGHPPPILREQ
jgi:hypothetical protein